MSLVGKGELIEQPEAEVGMKKKARRSARTSGIKAVVGRNMEAPIWADSSIMSQKFTSVMPC